MTAPNTPASDSFSTKQTAVALNTLRISRKWCQFVVQQNTTNGTRVCLLGYEQGVFSMPCLMVPAAHKDWHHFLLCG